MPLHFHLRPELHAMAKMAEMAKIASLWQFELDSKRGPLENGDFGENRQTAGDIQNVANIQIRCQKWPLQII